MHRGAGFGVGGGGDGAVAGDAIGVEARTAIGAVSGQRGIGRGCGGVQREVDGLAGRDVAGLVSLAHFDHIGAVGRAIGYRRGVGGAPGAKAACILFHTVLHRGAGFGVGGGGDGAVAGDAIGVEARTAIGAVRGQRGIGRGRRDDRRIRRCHVVEAVGRQVNAGGEVACCISRLQGQRLVAVFDRVVLGGERDGGARNRYIKLVGDVGTGVKYLGSGGTPGDCCGNYTRGRIGQSIRHREGGSFTTTLRRRRHERRKHRGQHQACRHGHFGRNHQQE